MSRWNYVDQQYQLQTHWVMSLKEIKCACALSIQGKAHWSKHFWYKGVRSQKKPLTHFIDITFFRGLTTSSPSSPPFQVMPNPKTDISRDIAAPFQIFSEWGRLTCSTVKRVAWMVLKVVTQVAVTRWPHCVGENQHWHYLIVILLIFR
jgi:hypothetical protein